MNNFDIDSASLYKDRIHGRAYNVIRSSNFGEVSFNPPRKTQQAIYKPLSNNFVRAFDYSSLNPLCDMIWEY